VLLPPERNHSQLDFRIVEAYLAGATSGALLTVMTAWLLGGFAAPIPAVARAILIAVGAVVIWMCERGPLSGKLPLPQNRRQIPLEVFGGGLVKGAYRFGFEMGTGVRTYLPSPAPYILLLALLFGRLTLASALFVAIGFALGRAIPLMLLNASVPAPRPSYLKSNKMVCLPGASAAFPSQRNLSKPRRL